MKDDKIPSWYYWSGRIASLFEDDPLREHPCTHAGVYTAHPETEIIAISDPNPHSLSAFKERWGVSSLYTDYEDMLEKEFLDIVSICTPTPTHCEIVERAAEAGVKAIFCEKPIATSLKEADAMIAACKKNQTTLVVNYPRRWDPDYCHIQSLIANGIIGDIKSIHGCYTSGLLMMGTHMIDIFRFLCGDVVQVFGSIDKVDSDIDSPLKPSENFTFDDPSGSGFLKFKNNAIGFIDGSMRKNYFIFEIDIQGSKRPDKNQRKWGEIRII